MAQSRTTLDPAEAILAALDQHGQSTAADIATTAGVAYSTTTRNLRELAATGRVEKLADGTQTQLRLPTTTYAGRYAQYGCGGFCGAIDPPPFVSCGGPRGGDLAVAATDDGHVGGAPFPAVDGTWAANNQAARDDFFFRAPHVLSVAAKRIIAAYYGAPPRRSFFTGCSNGGREALLLVTRWGIRSRLDALRPRRVAVAARTSA